MWHAPRWQNLRYRARVIECKPGRVIKVTRLGPWLRRSNFYKLLPLVPPGFDAEPVVNSRTWRVTLLHWDGRARPLSVGVTVDKDVRTCFMACT